MFLLLSTAAIAKTLDPVGIRVLMKIRILFEIVSRPFLSLK